MIKVNVYPVTRDEYLEEDVFVQVFLPSAPRKGEFIRLSRDHVKFLAEKMDAICYKDYVLGEKEETEHIKRPALGIHFHEWWYVDSCAHQLGVSLIFEHIEYHPPYEVVRAIVAPNQ